MAGPRKKRGEPPPQQAAVPAQPVEVLPVAAPEPQPQEPYVAPMRITDPVLPRNADDMVQNVMVRQLIDDQDHPEQIPPKEPDTVLSVLRELVDTARSGKPIAPLMPRLERFTTGVGDIAAIISSLVLRYKNDKLVEWLEIEEHLERFIRRSMRRGDLTAAEAMVLLQMAKNEIKKGTETLEEQVVKGVPDVDVAAAASKIDYVIQTTERGQLDILAKKTTPGGREIVRKLILTARERVK